LPTPRQRPHERSERRLGGRLDRTHFVIIVEGGFDRKALCQGTLPDTAWFSWFAVRPR
jgi:hypothetical protein